MPGTAVGAAVVAVVSVQVLGGVVGAAVIVACLVSTWSNEHRINRANSLGAGVASGFMDTVAATGGPPLALLYQHRPAQQIRTTMAVYFVVGAALSLVGLQIAGDLTWAQAQAAAELLPALLIGVVVGALSRRHLPAHRVRTAVLAVSALSAVVLVVRSLVGG